MAIELPTMVRDNSDTKAQFNFPINDALALDVASHLLHLGLSTYFVANAAEDRQCEATLAVMFLLPEAAAVFFAGQLSTQKTTKHTL
jgi:hypothetical protein